MHGSQTSPSLIEQTIATFTRLPGVGRKSAQRIVFHLLRQKAETALELGSLLPRLIDEIKHCSQCRNFTTELTCDLCRKRQDHPQLCIVESPVDLMAIETSGGFNGRYFVLHGYLSPIDGIGPHELGLDLLIDVLEEGSIHEVIIATNGSIDGETTCHYLQSLLGPLQLNITRIAQGIPLGGELEFTDSATLARAIAQRQQLEG